MSQNQPSVESFAIIPVAKWRSMEKRLKQQDETPVAPSREPSPHPSVTDVTTEEPKKKELKLKYRKVQMKKLLQHVERLEGSQEITSLENIDQLIETALGSSRKMVPNEALFFSFLFDNNLAHFVKNRSKIALYYKDRDNWFQI